ncbi:hypothetical protein Slin15195_G035870 [Septoria linicola]|uniref:Uncharacterized protein n=1 Tax=Septoria linicola TaxID=215465 RepID=A0A9Q9EIE5_9PEZI|nr:hypothetical protein Slin14017_G117230 [Septoria linicola]USW50268.1 hypothetical protein Slin15195_G035870 [Septoria linicola]
MSQTSETDSPDGYSNDESLGDISEYAHGVTYSSTDAIEAISRYYQFLIDLYLNKNDVEYPPEGGWPEITVENMRPLGKTDAVVELLKHIPYATWQGVGERKANVAGAVHFQPWATRARLATSSGWDVETEKLMTEGADYEHIPASVIGICNNESNQDHFLLDTALGLMCYSSGCPQGMKQHPLFKPLQTLHPVAFFPEDEVDWRDQPVWPIATFFELLKDEFKGLNFVSINSQRVLIAPRSNAGGYTDVLIPTVRAVFREHGWPHPEYDKDTCLSAVRRAIEDQHPDLYPMVYAQQ